MIVSRRRLTGILAGAALAMPAIRTRAADAIQLKFATADTMQDTSYSVAQHFADEVTGNAVGFDDGQGALERHARDSLWGA